jgi:hypothetical protein
MPPGRDRGKVLNEFESRFPWECHTRHDWNVVVPWLEVNIGRFNHEWYRYGSDIASGVTGWDPIDIYRFRDEQAAVLFKLKWT